MQHCQGVEPGVSRTSTSSGAWGFNNPQTKLAELSVSVKFKEWNTLFHSCKDQAGFLQHRQGVEPGVSRTARTSNWLADLISTSSGAWGFNNPRFSAPVTLTAPLDQVGRAGSLNRLQGVEHGVSQLQGSGRFLQHCQGVEPGVSQTARTSNWLVDINNK